MLLIVHQCFLMMLSRKIIVRKATLQTTNKFFKSQEITSMSTFRVLLLGIQSTWTEWMTTCGNITLVFLSKPGCLLMYTYKNKYTLNTISLTCLCRTWHFVIPRFISHTSFIIIIYKAYFFLLEIISPSRLWSSYISSPFRFVI